MYKISFVLVGLMLSLDGMANSIIDTENYKALTSDQRSFRVGEPIVILVVESTRAQSTTGTEVSKNFDVNLYANSDSGRSYSGSAGVNRNQDGDGKTARSGIATSTVSATISEVLPSGLLKIKGEHKLVINDESQTILVSGVVRAQDISKENTVISHRIADANIEIIGDGTISDADKPGIIARLFGWL